VTDTPNRTRGASWALSRPTFLVKLLPIFDRRYLAKRIDVLFLQLLNPHSHLLPLLCLQIPLHVINSKLGDAALVGRQFLLHLFELPSHLFKVSNVGLLHIHATFVYKRLECILVLLTSEFKSLPLVFRHYFSLYLLFGLFSVGCLRLCGKAKFISVVVEGFEAAVGLVGALEGVDVEDVGHVTAQN